MDRGWKDRVRTLNDRGINCGNRIPQHGIGKEGELGDGQAFGEPKEMGKGQIIARVFIVERS